MYTMFYLQKMPINLDSFKISHCSFLCMDILKYVMLLLDDMTVYNQSMIMGGNTLDKRHADFNDELGYIAPPNRKLPPVPGSNYNTCDRIKRGTLL